MRTFTYLVLSVLAVAPEALAFENAKVLPPGVRNLNVRQVNTNISAKTDGNADAQPLAQPLMQDLTFAKIAQGENDLKAAQLKAFLLTNGFDENAAVGSFVADLKGNLAVTAGIASYGVSSNVTLALAVPYYRASTSLAVGFVPNATGQAFLDSLAKPENNNTVSAREAGAKLNDAVGRLNTKLADNGYRELENWNDRGLGDVTLAAKARVYESGGVALATTSGFVAPTGRVDDPNILNDVAFGDGQWDVFGQLALDEDLGLGFGLNQFAKYTVQLPAERQVRAATKAESIEVDLVKADVKLGDKYDAGASLQYGAGNGFLAGVGGTYFKKVGDVYRGLEPDVKAKLQDGTDQQALNSELCVGFSTVPHYQAKRFAIPFEVKMTYAKQAMSRNMPITDLAQIDLNLFF